MPLPLHAMEIADGSTLNKGDRLILGSLPDIAVLPSAGSLTLLGSITAGQDFTSLPTLTESGGTPSVTGATAVATALKVISAAPAAIGLGVAINDTFNPAGGTLADGGVATKLTATHIQAATAVVNAGGSGGTPGAVTITGTTGTGTKFQATGTINGGGALVGPLVVTVGGDYTVGPTSLAAEPVTGGSLSGATVTLVMGAKTFALTTVGGYTVPPASPAALVDVVGTGTGVTATLSYGLSTARITHGGSVTITGAPAFTVSGGGGTGASIAAGTLAGNDNPVHQRIASLVGLPASYSARVGANFLHAGQWISDKDASGFTVHTQPLSGATVPAGGRFDVLAIG
jgi:hypothetical protein